tara:strand:+ start:355 stop:696 length:342 start_codon:yes stop_codon:yes gene_type:complete
MTILQSSTDSQTINFIPREYTEGTTYTITIKDETTNKEVFNSTATIFTALDYYFQYSSVFTLVENTMYMLEIKDGTNVTFKDKIFCTNQNVTTYSVNDNEYIKNTIANDFIVL